MNNRFKFLFVAAIVMVAFTSCVEDAVEELTPNVVDFSVTSEATPSTIELSWKPVEGVSWFTVYAGEAGKELEEIGTHQDIINNTITYTISNLKAETTYDIKVDGTDYLSGGKLVASTKVKATTTK